MEVTPRDVERLPHGNIHVPREEFAEVWGEAERLLEAAKVTGGDWYLTGVVMTCRWLANAIIPMPNGRREPARAPATGRSASRAHKEMIEPEVAAAERKLMSTSKAGATRSGWLEGIVATFNWAWHKSATSPLGHREDRAG